VGVRALASGWDPSGAAAFVTWTERGRERWTAYSRDGGESWSSPQPTGAELLLRDGAVAPGQPLPAVAQALQMPPEGRLYLVQFRTIGLPEWRQALAGFARPSRPSTSCSAWSPTIPRSASSAGSATGR
jgi:hypothetical protein